MAEHLFLEPTEKPEASSKYLANVAHTKSAEEALTVLSGFPEVEVRDIQFPAGRTYTCWYVSIKDFPKKPVLNLTLQSNGALNVEFRYMEYVDPLVRDELQWQTNNWVYARISEKAFTTDEVIEMMNDYIPKVVEANIEGLLRRGGTSQAETVIADILDRLYDNWYFHGIRPEWLRNNEGNLLELDFLIEEENVAIEVQGPHHNKDLYGKLSELERKQENDNFKVSKCQEKNISIIWMDSEGVQRHLARLPFKVQVQTISDLIQLARNYHVCHIIWNSSDEKPQIIPRKD